MEVTIDITNEAMDDLRALPTKEVQRAALQWIQRLKRKPRLGTSLEWRWGQDLRDCRKLYVGRRDRPLELDLVERRRSEDDGAEFRIVHRLLPSEQEPEVAQVFAVGAKYDDGGGVYQKAAERYRLLLAEE